MQDLNNKNNYMSIEGNIGVGKSTFLKILQKNLDIKAVSEPVSTWENISGHNLLAKFYDSPKRWSYTFQNYAFISRIKSLHEAFKNNINNKLIIEERSVFSDRYCFAQNLYEQGLMDDLEWNIYLSWFNWLTQFFAVKPIGFIYLKTSPEICYERIHKRNRKEEHNITLEYIKELHKKHEEWLIEKKDISNSIKNVPVLVLNCNKDFVKDITFQKELVCKVKDFIENLKTDCI